MNIDWSKAQDWVIAHALYAFGGEISEVWVGEDKYQRLDQPKSFPYGGGVGDSRHNPCRYQFRYETLRPAAWAGEGLPPVGTVCESMWNESRDEWFKAKVFGVNEHGQPIFRWEEGVKKYEYQASPLAGHQGNPYFRPIRTPDQIAAEQRDHAVAEMSQATQGAKDWADAFRMLHDAGYRKQVEP